MNSIKIIFLLFVIIFSTKLSAFVCDDKYQAEFKKTNETEKDLVYEVYVVNKNGKEIFITPPSFGKIHWYSINEQGTFFETGNLFFKQNKWYLIKSNKVKQNLQVWIDAGYNSCSIEIFGILDSEGNTVLEKNIVNFFNKNQYIEKQNLGFQIQQKNNFLKWRVSDKEGNLKELSPFRGSNGVFHFFYKEKNDFLWKRKKAEKAFFQNQNIQWTWQYGFFLDDFLKHDKLLFVSGTNYNSLISWNGWVIK